MNAPAPIGPAQRLTATVPMTLPVPRMVLLWVISAGCVIASWAILTLVGGERQRQLDRLNAYSDNPSSKQDSDNSAGK
jgi:hypothetical protein